MKKTYLAPTVQVVRIEQSQMLCVSVQSTAGLRYGEEMPSDFSSDDIRWYKITPVHTKGTFCVLFKECLIQTTMADSRMCRNLPLFFLNVALWTEASHYTRTPKTFWNIWTMESAKPPNWSWGRFFWSYSEVRYLYCNSLLVSFTFPFILCLSWKMIIRTDPVIWFCKILG